MHRCSCVGRYLRRVYARVRSSDEGDRASPAPSYMYIYNIIVDTDLRGETKNSAPRTKGVGTRAARRREREREREGRCRDMGTEEAGTRRSARRFSFYGQLVRSLFSTTIVFANGLGANRLLPVANSFPKNARAGSISRTSDLSRTTR